MARGNDRHRRTRFGLALFMVTLAIVLYLLFTGTLSGT